MDKILYLGDTSLTSSACYLAGVMSKESISFDYAASDKAFDSALFANRYSAVVISDYPGANFTAEQIAKLRNLVEGGTGLVMIGGWESFTGTGGDYGKTKLAEVLPVNLKASDDRINWSAPCLVEKVTEHPIVEQLPFNSSTPVVGGFNQVTAKPNALAVLNVRRFTVNRSSTGLQFHAAGVDPLLVTGTFGKGRTVAYASDVAPHWVGGFVDWGDKRVVCHASGANEVEVGNWYATFFANIIRWASNSK